MNGQQNIRPSSRFSTGPALRIVLPTFFLISSGFLPVLGQVRIYFSALDRSEKPLTGLTATDFELKLNGKVSPLNQFSGSLAAEDRSIPLLAWILIDCNPNIQSGVIKEQARAASEIFGQIHPNSVVGVKLVSDRSETLAPLAHDAASLGSAFSQFGSRRRELRAGGSDGSLAVGEGGILRAVELAIEEIKVYQASTLSLQNREVHRAIMILSDGSVDPWYKEKTLWMVAARESVFLYPVFIPRAQYGAWLRNYFDLAKKTAGVASVFGALKPGSEIRPLPMANTLPNALSFNILHMKRDLNAKYSFTVLNPGGRELTLQLKCLRKGVQIRIPRQRIP